MAASLSSNPAQQFWNYDDGSGVLRLSGQWSLASMPGLEAACEACRKQVVAAAKTAVSLDLEAVEVLDTFGAALMLRLRDALTAKDVKAEFDNVPGHSRELFDRVMGVSAEQLDKPRVDNALIRTVLRVGAGARAAGQEAVDLLAMTGLVFRVMAGVIRHPSRLRRHDLVHQMEATGLNSLPIVGLLSLLIGMVLAYLSAVQLQNFGAEILVVNIIGLAVLREIGILLASIILAGRSGSAFTAQIGTMKVNQELDAMQTMGLNVVEVLVLPRILALVITLPLVGFYGAMAGLLGGALAGYFLLDIGPAIFLQQLKLAVSASDIIVTFIKAPVFAFAIALVGCHQGLKVSGSAQSVGEMTTRSVVVSICLVILLDAMFAILFQEVGL